MGPRADRKKSLAQLDGDWGAPEFESNLVLRCHQLSRRPIGELTVEDLRTLVGQKIGLPHLIPLALEYLVEDPLASGDMNRGDLLRSVLAVPDEFWRENEDLYWELREVLTEVDSIAETLRSQADRRQALLALVG